LCTAKHQMASPFVHTRINNAPTHSPAQSQQCTHSLTCTISTVHPLTHLHNLHPLTHLHNLNSAPTHSPAQSPPTHSPAQSQQRTHSLTCTISTHSLTCTITTTHPLTHLHNLDQQLLTVRLGLRNNHFLLFGNTLHRRHLM